MEADSTTVEQDYELNEAYDGDRENHFLDEISRDYPNFREAVLPLLEKGRERELVEWMSDVNLLQSSMKCFKNLPDCKMTVMQSKVVDRYQWQCQNCHQKIQIRENSFFKNVYCPLRTIIKIILAWCRDEDYELVACVFGLKKQIVNGIYEKIEKAVCGRPLPQLNSSSRVFFILLYPNFADELYPVSSKNDSAFKTHHKIVCIADTECPAQYWLHLLTGVCHVQAENNNTVAKKVTPGDEIIHMVEKIISPGGYCVLGEGAQLVPVRDFLLSKNMVNGIISTNHLMTQADLGVRSFLVNKVWEPIIKLCEAAQDLPKNKIQSYLNCSLWKWRSDPPDDFFSVVDLISRQDYKAPTGNRK